MLTPALLLCGLLLGAACTARLQPAAMWVVAIGAALGVCRCSG